MKYSCNIINDLLPMYVDDMASKESKTIIEEHLLECDDCKKNYEAMKAYENYSKKATENSEDFKLASGLKKIKKKINKKIAVILSCSVAAVILFVSVFNLLFTIPVKTIKPDDVYISVNNYMLRDISHVVDANERNTIEDDDIFYAYTENEVYNYMIDEEDNGNQNFDNKIIYSIDIPDHTYLLTKKQYEEYLEQSEYVTAVIIDSKYRYDAISYSIEDNTLYLDKLKTTLFNNSYENHHKYPATSVVEFNKIDKVVYVGDGKEIILWEGETVTP